MNGGVCFFAIRLIGADITQEQTPTKSVSVGRPKFPCANAFVVLSVTYLVSKYSSKLFAIKSVDSSAISDVIFLNIKNEIKSVTKHMDVRIG